MENLSIPLGINYYVAQRFSDVVFFTLQYQDIAVIVKKKTEGFLEILGTQIKEIYLLEYSNESTAT